MYIPDIPLPAPDALKALEEAITAHYLTLPCTARMDCRPQHINLAFIPECRAIVDVPTSETVTADHFAGIVPALAQTWDADRKKDLTEYLLPHLGDIAADVDPLALAIASFTFSAHVTCSAPIRTMRYPAILKHRCSRGNDCFYTARVHTQEYFEDDLYTRTTKTLDGGVEFEAEIRERNYDHLVKRVPFHIGELDESEHARDTVDRIRRVVAMTQEPSDAIHARSWSNAYEHDRYHTTNPHCPASTRGIPEWRRADDADMAKVRVFKKAESAKTRFGYACQWSCALCVDFDVDTDAMATHLANTMPSRTPAGHERRGSSTFPRSRTRRRHSQTLSACGGVSVPR
ncbi:hypothetical protein VTO73DRAFT_2451 [Trametes versicolor]